jgi:ANTAR domain-containing protein/PAS domain-containing protein
VTTSIPGSTGTFHFSRGTGTWTWSEQVYAIYGFAPGAVLPTTQLILAHQHPEDRAEVEQVLEDAFETGTPHTLWHRIRDAHGNTRQVVMLGAGEFAGDGALVGFSGILVDLTEAVRRTTAREVEEAMELMSQSRPAIEQAKGALMISYGLDPDRAFQLLRSYSQRTNVKLREVARNVVDALVDRDLPIGSRATWDELAADLTDKTPEERSG